MQRELAELRRQVEENGPRVARTGGWEERYHSDMLTSRLPDLDGTPGTGGFDAGIACALDLIPRERQGLAAKLHAAYTPESVQQVRKEIRHLEANSASCWWLAACAVCDEDESTPEHLLDQVRTFQQLAADPAERLRRALEELEHMTTSFEVDEKGFPEAVRDGGMQGAYIAGYDVAGMYASRYGMYFVGTFHETLGLEDFPWKEPGDPAAPDPERRRGRSGPVHGSPQYVRCSDREEYLRVREALKVRER